MRPLSLTLAAFALAAVSVTPARAASTIELFEWTMNIDGAVADSLNSDPFPAGVNAAGFNTTTGLGSISVSLSGAGAHFVGLFVDHEIDQAINTYFNESGAVTGAAAAGQSWEIDEPGFRAPFGDIWTNLTDSDNVAGSQLDNSNGIAATTNDVSMALGWDYTLAAGQTSAITFLISETAPASGFYLTQTDPDSVDPIYFSSTLVIRTPGGAIPEPGTFALYGTGLGLFGLWAASRRQLARA